MPFEKKRIRVPENVLFRELDGESVILNVDDDRYYGLDDIGTRIWQVLTECGSLERTFQALKAEYDVDPGTLRRDISGLVDKLTEKGLLDVITDGN